GRVRIRWRVGGRAKLLEERFVETFQKRFVQFLFRARCFRLFFGGRFRFGFHFFLLFDLQSRTRRFLRVLRRSDEKPSYHHEQVFSFQFFSLVIEATGSTKLIKGEVKSQNVHARLSEKSELRLLDRLIDKRCNLLDRHFPLRRDPPDL